MKPQPRGTLAYDGGGYSRQNNSLGVWMLVSEVRTDAAGNKEPALGAHPMGRVMFSPESRYSFINTRADLPKFASNNRAKEEENAAVVEGSLSHFGQYSVDEAEKSIPFRIESATLSELELHRAKPALPYLGRELTWRLAAASRGGSVELVWR
jgi:hypothetical protein